MILILSQKILSQTGTKCKKAIYLRPLGLSITLGNNLLSNVHALDSGRVSISVGAFDGTSRAIYDQNPKLLEMAKNDSYQLIVTG